jgi:hypothetical protein
MRSRRLPSTDKLERNAALWKKPTLATVDLTFRLILQDIASHEMRDCRVAKFSLMKGLEWKVWMFLALPRRSLLYFCSNNMRESRPLAPQIGE